MQEKLPDLWGRIIESKVVNGQILYKVWIDQLYGPNVKHEDLPFIPLIHPAGMINQVSSPGALSNGTIVKIFKDPGQAFNGFGTVFGLIHPVTSNDTNMPGATFSLAAQYGRPLDAQTRQIQIPPNLQKILNENGVEVVKILEKGLSKLTDVYGVASHGTQSPLMGAKVPQITNIPTPKTGNASVISPSVASNLPGTPFALGSLLSMMPTQMKNQLLQGLPASVQEGLNTVLNMTQSFTYGNFGNGVATGTTINPAIFFENILTNLAHVHTMDDLLSILTSMISDPQQTGTSGNTFFGSGSGAFGTYKFTLDISGKLISTLEGDASNLLSGFKSMLQTFPSTKGTLFDTVNDLPGMLDRMLPEVSQGIVSMLGNVAKSPAPSANMWVQ